MAPFNPEVRNTDAPNYLGYSKGTSQPQPNKVFEELFKGVGDVFGLGVKGLDAYNKDTIDQKIYGAVDSEREEFTDALETAKDVVATGGKSPLQNPAANAPLTLSPEEENVPDGVTDLIGAVRNLHEGRSSRAFSQTYYKGRLASIAKELRSEYPGYRPYIDQQIASITGGNPANDYISNMVADLNAMTRTSSTNDPRTKVAAEVMKYVSKYPEADKVYIGVINGTVEPATALAWINRNSMIEALHNQREAARKDTKGTREEQAALDEQNAISLTQSMASNDFQNFATFSGPTIEQTMKSLELAANGKVKINSAQAQEAASIIASRAMTLRTQLRNTLYTRKEGEETSMGARLGVEKSNKIIEEAVKNHMDVAEYIKNEKWGAAFAAANSSRALIDDMGIRLMSDPEMGEMNQMIAALSKNASTFMGSIAQQVYANGFSTRMNNFIQHKLYKMAAQPGLGTAGVPYTAADALEANKEAAKKDPSLIPALPKANAQIVRMIDQIAGQGLDDDGKANIARAFFSEKNRGLISKFEREVIDPQTGRVKPGQYSIFGRLTSDKVTKEIVRLSEDRPELLPMYRDWVSETFGKELFGRDFADFGNLPADPGNKLYWDDGKETGGIPHWVHPPYRETPINPNAPTAGRIITPKAEWDYVEQRIQRINTGLARLANVAKATNMGDVSAYMLKTMLESGADLSKVGGGLPQQMVDAIVQAKKGGKVPKFDEGSGEYKLPFQAAPEDKGGDLNEFIRNPVGKANTARVGPVWGDPLSSDFEEKHLTPIKTSTGKTVKVNKVAAEAFQGLINELEDMGYNIKELGGHALRKMKGANKISQHAFGNAIDINPAQNPWHTSKTNLPKNISQIAAKYGLSWGGDWSKENRDPMHFEYVGGPRREAKAQ